MTPESRMEYSFTRAYLTLPARFAARKEIAGPRTSAATLAQKRVGVIEGTAHEAMSRDWFPDIKPVTFSRHEWMFDALKTGSVDAVFGDALQFSFWLASRSAEECCGFLDGPYVSRGASGRGPGNRREPAQCKTGLGF
jgi:polar amino acid transport system substrate-binding protein